MPSLVFPFHADESCPSCLPQTSDEKNFPLYPTLPWLSLSDISSIVPGLLPDISKTRHFNPRLSSHFRSSLGQNTKSPASQTPLIYPKNKKGNIARNYDVFSPVNCTCISEKCRYGIFLQIFTELFRSKQSPEKQLSLHLFWPGHFIAVYFFCPNMTLFFSCTSLSPRICPIRHVSTRCMGYKLSNVKVTPIR